MSDTANHHQPEPWHLSRAVNIGHILSTVSLVGVLMWYQAGQDNRLTQAELNIEHLQESRLADQQRTDKKFDEIRAYMLRIESKLDRIIESDR